MTKLNDSDRIKVAFVGGHTRRWHAADIVGEERVDSHTWGMLALVHILHPAPPVELLGAITFHDSPAELFSGDIPYGAKQAFPELGRADVEIGARAQVALGVDYGLDPESKWWLRFADMASAVLFTRRQVAQGNSLMSVVALDCEETLSGLANASGAPADAARAIGAVLGCRVDLPLSRNLGLLESLAS